MITITNIQEAQRILMERLKGLGVKYTLCRAPFSLEEIEGRSMIFLWYNDENQSTHIIEEEYKLNETSPFNE